jgi:hypothetical protein
LSANPPASPTSAAPPAIAGTFARSATWEIRERPFCDLELVLRLRLLELGDLRPVERELPRERELVLFVREPLERLELGRLRVERLLPEPPRERLLVLRELEVFVWAISASLLDRLRGSPTSSHACNYPACGDRIGAIPPRSDQSMRAVSLTRKASSPFIPRSA